MPDQTYEEIRDAYLRGGTDEAAFTALVEYFKRVEGGTESAANNFAENTMRLWAEPGQKGGVPSPFETEKEFWKKVGFPEEDPRAAWQRSLGLPSVGRNPFQEWLANQVTPAFAGWGAGAAARKQGITPIPGQAGQVGALPFSRFVGPSGAQMGQSAAYGLLNQMRGKTSKEQQDWIDLIGAQGGPGLQNVLEAALRGKGHAGFVSRALAGRLPELRTGWSAETLGGAEEGDTFLDYLLKNVGF